MKCVKTVRPRNKTAIGSGCQVVFTIISKGCVKQLALGKRHAAASRALSVCRIFPRRVWDVYLRTCMWIQLHYLAKRTTDASNIRAVKTLRATNLWHLMAPFRCPMKPARFDDDSVILQALMVTSGCSTRRLGSIDPNWAPEICLELDLKRIPAISLPLSSSWTTSLGHPSTTAAVSHHTPGWQQPIGMSYFQFKW